MAIQSDETLVTKGDLKTLYTNKILPYLGGNMMMQTGVSDYYSEDEKVVGVWTDGKPIYQKTISGTVSAGVNGINIGTTVDKVVNSYGWFSMDNWYQPFNTVNDAFQSYIKLIAYDNSADSAHKNKVWLVTNTNTWNSGNFAVTIQYTKTTDTASSALTTPGCYDLNRPDLWPENKEIFFGNGLYGYRKTGTNVTVPKQSRTDIVLITTGNANTKIYNSGGTLENASWKYAIPSSHTTGNGDQFIWFNKNNGSWTNNSIMFYISNNSCS